MKHLRRSILSMLLVLLLVAALTGCGQSQTNTEASSAGGNAETSTVVTGTPETGAFETSEPSAPVEVQRQEMGEGSKLFYFDVSFSNGETASYAIHTDADTVGAALVDLNLIAGEDSQYGLYVKTVGEETLDYEADGMYWAFYVDGAYADTGVDATTISNDTVYSFVATKG